MSGTKFTPTEKKMLEILSDGRPHRRKELHACCGPSSERGTVYRHVSSIRTKLKPKGENIVCVLLNRSVHYQHVRLLQSPYDGRS